MRMSETVALFERMPRRTAVLAVICAVLSAIFLTDLLPQGQKYGPDHDTFMGLLALALAVFLGRCAWRGFRQNKP